MRIVDIYGEKVKAFSPDEIEQVLKGLDIKWEKKATYDKDTDKKGFQYVLSLPISFDIETSSWYEDDNGNTITNDDANNKDLYNIEKLHKRACMYVWMMAFGTDDRIIVGRTWQEFIDTLATLKEAFKLDEKHLMYIWCHNLEYEYQWIRGYFTWGDMFNLANRSVVYANTSGIYYEDPDFPTHLALADFSGFCFKCSYILSGVKEAKLPKIMNKYSNRCSKLTGSLDYNLIRHSETELTNKEWAYCINDVRLVNWYIREKMEEDGGLTKILLTKTGYVRRYVRDNCFYSDSNVKHSKRDDKYIKYKNMINGMKIDLPTYHQLKRSFQGGFTHAGHINAGKVLYNVGSWDIASSYPTVMVCELFPMSAFKKVEIKNKKDAVWYLNNKCCLFDVRLTNVREKYINELVQIDFEHILSVSKCEEFAAAIGEEFIPEGVEIDNGRIIKADKIYFSCNEIDLQNLKKFYDWDGIQFTNFRVADKGYLPTDLVKCLLKLFQDKTNYKKYDKTGTQEEIYYKRAKEYINSCFGMSVTDILRRQYEVTSEGVWQEIPETLETLTKRLEDTLDSNNNFLNFAWGCYVTSYARRNLFDAILFSGENHCYSDTDSEKALFNDSMNSFFDKYNSEIDRKMNLAFDFHKLPRDSHKATYEKDGKIITKCLGYFEFEGIYKRFATCGAKRYIVEKENGEIEITVAGLSKDCVEYLKERYKEELFEKFSKAEIYVPREYTNKLAHTYIDYSIKGIVKDYKGNTSKYAELTSLHLDKVAFDMSISDEYYMLLFGDIDQEINKIY